MFVLIILIAAACLVITVAGFGFGVLVVCVLAFSVPFGYAFECVFVCFVCELRVCCGCGVCFLGVLLVRVVVGCIGVWVFWFVSACGFGFVVFLGFGFRFDVWLSGYFGVAVI